MSLEGVLDEKQLGPNSPSLATGLVLRQFPYDINGDWLYKVFWHFLDSSTPQFTVKFVI